jgi:hypothetical protein
MLRCAENLACKAERIAPASSFVTFAFRKGAPRYASFELGKFVMESLGEIARAVRIPFNHRHSGTQAASLVEGNDILCYCARRLSAIDPPTDEYRSHASAVRANGYRRLGATLHSGDRFVAPVDMYLTRVNICDIELRSDLQRGVLGSTDQVEGYPRVAARRSDRHTRRSHSRKEYCTQWGDENVCRKNDVNALGCDR